MMKNKTMPDVIIDLHEKGYTEDFNMKDGSYFWTQEQLTVPKQEFYIAETYQVRIGAKQHQLLGVVWELAGLKGIVICATKIPC